MFNADDLQICNWQYTVRHTSVDCFVIGELVFLKSNPECPMTVTSMTDKRVSTNWYSLDGKLQTCDFPPECILQYKYAGLQTYKLNTNVNFN